MPDEDEEQAASEARAVLTSVEGAVEGTSPSSAWERARALPWREIASAPPVWGMAAASIAGNYFLYFAIAWLPSYFSYQVSAAHRERASPCPRIASKRGGLSAPSC